MDHKEQLKQLLGNTSALLEAMRYSTSTASGDAANIGKYASYQTFLRKYNELVKQAAPLLLFTNVLDTINLDKIKGINDTTWPQQKVYFELAYSNTALLKSLLEAAVGYAEDATQKLKDFLQSNLRRAIFADPEREVEICDGIEVLIVGRGMAKGTDYDRETGRTKSSGKESVPDFIFPVLKLCLEVKLSQSTEKRRVIVDQINADIRAYAKLYERQLYIVYDVGTIRDEAEFKRDLENAPGVSVVIVKH